MSNDRNGATVIWFQCYMIRGMMRSMCIVDVYVKVLYLTEGYMHRCDNIVALHVFSAPWTPKHFRYVALLYIVPTQEKPVAPTRRQHDASLMQRIFNIVAAAAEHVVHHNQRCRESDRIHTISWCSLRGGKQWQISDKSRLVIRATLDWS